MDPRVTNMQQGRPEGKSQMPNGRGPQEGQGPRGGYDMPQGAPPGGSTEPFVLVDNVSGAFTMPGFIPSYQKDVLHGNLDKPALWFVDIRNFRSINPNFGFMQGNVLLRAVYEGVRQHISATLPIARLGADRFVFVSEGLSLDEAQQRFEALSTYVTSVANAHGITTQIVLVGGIYYICDIDYQAGNHNPAMDYASIAHRNAKEGAAGVLVKFSDEDLERDRRRMTIEQTIDVALAEGQIEVWYQPQVDYVYGEVIGAEALARWNHPDLGLIMPTEFIPILENCGRIHDLDLYVWEEACRNAGHWREAADGTPVPISVNVSRLEMFENGLMEHFLELQEKYNLPDGSLHLEVTESAFVEEADRLYEVINRMREHHVLVEMDDFGSGLSSLNMLKDVPVDVVKIDMGFMKSALEEDRGGVVLSSVIRMLQGLDTPIIAEGVETLEQAEMLKNMGCRLMQGFHFSRPMPIDDFESFIASNNTVESSVQRKRLVSHVEELTSFDPSSSYLFNHAIGATIFFYVNNESTESVLANDEFYEACGLERSDFGNTKINPIMEIEPESRATLWRAASEAREKGAAFCSAKVRLTGRWIDCVMRYLGTSSRGDVHSLNIVRWSDSENDHETINRQISQDGAWAISYLDRIARGGFIRCAIDDALTIDYASQRLIVNSGLSREEFVRSYHNTLVEFIIEADRQALLDAVRDGVSSGNLIECKVRVHFGHTQVRDARFYGRVLEDEDGQWLYGMLFQADVDDGHCSNGDSNGLRKRVLPFDYLLDEDKLVVLANGNGGQDRVVEHWSELLENIDSRPDIITPSSATRVLATVRDLKHHPTSGFTDLKVKFPGSEVLRWYHVNYTCEADEEGNTKVVHGYAQDANDQMGSAKWWRKQAEIDQLTGLLNRNAVEQDINLAMRTHGVGMMFMIDLDGFKRVNDDLGHLTGDALLRDVAETLSEHFREGDVLGRYGGDEFVAFVPFKGNGDPIALSEARSADIIEAIRAIDIPDGTHPGCSIGIALSHDRDATFYDLLEVADRAMYESKESGKGRMTLIEI